MPVDHSTESPSGLFVGLTTIDIVYQVDNPPRVDEKIVAHEQTVAAGGPATNAAVAFSFLGGRGLVHSVIGRHALSEIVVDDLRRQAVEIVDMAPEAVPTPSFSSVMVKAATGERSVVSVNAEKVQASLSLDVDRIREMQIVLVDGHQMEAGIAASRIARACGIPTVMDGGSWKAGSERLVGHIDYAICSERFLPPGCDSVEDSVRYLKEHQVPFIAVTNGSHPIRYWTLDNEGEIPIPTIAAVDTLGAGDFLHGAFAFYMTRENAEFVHALAQASRVASYSCRYFGTRAWMGHYVPEGN